jgi:hypothetical protein
MALLIGWTVLSIAIGFLARLRGDSFFGGFLASLVLSPLVGFALTMLKIPSEGKTRTAPTTVTARG